MEEPKHILSSRLFGHDAYLVSVGEGDTLRHYKVMAGSWEEAEAEAIRQWREEMGDEGKIRDS